MLVNPLSRGFLLWEGILLQHGTIAAVPSSAPPVGNAAGKVSKAWTATIPVLSNSPDNFQSKIQRANFCWASFSTPFATNQGNHFVHCDPSLLSCPIPICILHLITFEKTALQDTGLSESWCPINSEPRQITSAHRFAVAGTELNYHFKCICQHLLQKGSRI